MKHSIYAAILLLFTSSLFISCKKDSGAVSSSAAGFVTGKITDAAGNALPDIKVTIEHTLWTANYVFATTDDNGNYKVAIPAEPAGDWTAKAQIEKNAYGEDYTFDLECSNTNAFNNTESVTRNFTWKISGRIPGKDDYYGAHVDLYELGTNVPVNQVKLIFTPLENTLIDGSIATELERTVEDVAGTYMVTDIPIGKYSVKAVYAGKALLLDNRHDDSDAPATEQPIVFGKQGYLGETGYNIEFWLSE